MGMLPADDEKPAMGEIDDVAQIENERKAERHQHVEGADDEPVGVVKQDKLRHNSPEEKHAPGPGGDRSRTSGNSGYHATLATAPCSRFRRPRARSCRPRPLRRRGTDLPGRPCPWTAPRP